MEEDSLKRRERLQSLRAQAASSPAIDPASPVFPPAQLSNPLAQTQWPTESSPAAARRFDYYSNPMSAFSGNKRRSSNAGGYIPSPRPNGPRSYHAANTGSPTPHISMSQSPNIHQNDSWRTPVQYGSPFLGHTGGQFSTPQVWNNSYGSPRHNYTDHRPRYAFRSPSFEQGHILMHSSGRGGSPMSDMPVGSSKFGRCAGGRFGSIPHSGRGNGGFSGGRSFSSSPGPGRSGKWWRGHGDATAQKSEHFFVKDMVEDPWKDLKPVVGNILVPRGGQDSWLPKSITSKKARYTGSGTEFKDGASFAEYLALALEETTNDESAT